MTNMDILNTFNIIDFISTCSGYLNIVGLIYVSIFIILSLSLINTMMGKKNLDTTHKIVTTVAGGTIVYKTIKSGGGSNSDDDKEDKNKNKTKDVKDNTTDSNKTNNESTTNAK